MIRDFIITVDTEGDNLWSFCDGDTVSTQNTKYIPRFQELCEKYGFKPVYLTNYEMAMDDAWVEYSSKKLSEGKCEIGMHLHAWNNPPLYELPPVYSGLPYVTEYPTEIIEEKVAEVMHLLNERYHTDIISHRSGRWALNDEYLDILYKYGIRVDCSTTPGIDLGINPGRTVAGGNDYSSYPKNPYMMKNGVLEVPMSTRSVRRFYGKTFKERLKNLLLGDKLWLRPIRGSLAELNYLTAQIEKENETKYLEFMIHSSELMPGGSSYFKTQGDIDNMFKVMDAYFSTLSDRGYRGCTLGEYYEKFIGVKNDK